MEIIKSIVEFDSSEAGFEVHTSEQVIRLCIDNISSCCEQWGWFWCNDNPQDFVGAQLLDVKLTDTALNAAPLDENGNVREFAGSLMFVNLETDRGTLQFVAYNDHNGYYGHEARVQCRQLNHSEHL